MFFILDILHVQELNSKTGFTFIRTCLSSLPLVTGTAWRRLIVEHLPVLHYIVDFIF